MKEITRRDMLRGSAAVGTGLALGAADLLHPQRAAAAVKPAWMATVSNCTALGLWPTNPLSVTYNPTAPPASPPTQPYPVAAIGDYTKLGSIPSGYQFVMYDIEKRSDTPTYQQQDPWTYGALFGQNTPLFGIWAPARDLYYVQGIVKPPKPGESVDAWYERTQLAAVCQSYNYYLIQSESDEGNTTTYHDFVVANNTIAKNANASITVFAELSTGTVSADQMISAAKSVWPSVVAGFYLAVPDGDHTKMQQVVQALGGP